MKALQRKFYFLFHYLGMAGIAGLMLMLASVGLYLFLVLPGQHEIRQRSAELAEIKARPRKVETEAVPELGDAKALDEFYGQFPAVESLSGLVEQLHALAKDEGVLLEVGEYKLQVEDDGKLFRYEILLPIRTGYPDMRRFIDEALHQLPSLGLKDISFKREAIGENSMQAKLNMVMYLSRGM